MTKVELYYADYCPYCRNAKTLLESKKVDFTLYDVDSDAALREEAKTRSGRQTIPQIFINDQHIGGCDDLFALESDGKLDTLLKG